MKSRILFICIVLSAAAFAQDSHYWNLQYGAKATLLGGAVIGSIDDLSATYYNPGAVAQFNDPKVILSAKVYQYERIKVKNGVGINKDLVFSSITPSPSFIAFRIKIDSTGKNKLAFSLLTRQTSQFDLETRQTIANPGGSNSFTTGIFSLTQDFDELWGGITYARRMNKIIGLGITDYVAYRNQNTRFQTDIEELEADTNISSMLVFRNFKFYNYRTLLKAGISADLRPITLGLTITSPSLNISGKGSFGYDNFISDPKNISNNIYESNAQDSLKSTYQSSWAIGIGAAYWGKKTTLHISAEWYNAINKYHLLPIQPFTSQTSGRSIQNEINQQLKSVTNLGAGLEYNFNPEVSIAGSIITDFSANIEDLRYNISLTRWDIYHISAGTNFNVGKKAEITLGLSYSFGKDTIKQITDIENPNDLSNAVKPDADIQFIRVKLLFGFIF